MSQQRCTGVENGSPGAVTVVPTGRTATVAVMPLPSRTARALAGHIDVARLEEALSSNDADLRTDLSTYLSEALFFIEVLGPDLAALPKHGRVAEIGSGIGLLSMLVASHGHHVTSYEAHSAGFSAMARSRRLLLDTWTGPEIDVTWIDDTFPPPVHDTGGYDLVYAMNVIEHVPQPSGLIEEATRRLNENGVARFVCANYDFPYEPHVGMPTVWNKSLTRRLFARRIAASPIPDVEQFWDELSWPSVRSLRRDLGGRDMTATFRRSATAAYVQRVEADPTFSERKGRMFGALAGVLRPLLGLATRSAPLGVLPVIDLTTTPTRPATGRHEVDLRSTTAIDLTERPGVSAEGHPG